MKVATVILFLFVWPLNVVTFAWMEDDVCYEVLDRGRNRAKKEREEQDQNKDRRKKKRKKKRQKKKKRRGNKKTRHLEQNHLLPENEVGNVTHWDNKSSFSYKQGTQEGNEEELQMMEHDEEFTETLDWKLRGRKMRERTGVRPVDPEINQNIDTLVSMFQDETDGNTVSRKHKVKKNVKTTSSGKKPFVFPHGDYGLKLWWKVGFSCWQFENIDRKWCMHYNGEYPDIERCDTRSSMIVTVLENISSYSDKVTQIKMGDKCFERVLEERGEMKERIDLNTCDPDNRWQWFVFYDASEEEEGEDNKFEIRPYTDRKKCVTQEHHPKPYEPLFCQRCNQAKASFHRSAWWEFY
uniref:Ricin B lectin domain-containing protein n=1 Tax=Attheya septentrionalis TaxID=420275 RepID=A0A7S2XSL1_9STRA|mmetsp:Transcript_4995/g.8773  ORF Transcript_4995/g.8773 Transcript_4995/m.8773 type:complete len:352 (+) Transcript_4995:179-1234(+)